MASLGLFRAFSPLPITHRLCASRIPLPRSSACRVPSQPLVTLSLLFSGSDKAQQCERTGLHLPLAQSHPAMKPPGSEPALHTRLGLITPGQPLPPPGSQHLVHAALGKFSGMGMSVWMAQGYPYLPPKLTAFL